MSKYNIKNLTSSIISFTELGITVQGNDLAKGVQIESQEQWNEVNGVKAAGLIQMAKACADGKCDCSCNPKETKTEDKETKTEDKAKPKKKRGRGRPKGSKSNKSNKNKEAKKSTNKKDSQKTQASSSKSIKKVDSSKKIEVPEHISKAVVVGEGGVQQKPLNKSDGSFGNNDDAYEKPITEEELSNRYTEQEDASIKYAEKLDVEREVEQEEYLEKLKNQSKKREDVVVGGRDSAKKVSPRNSAVPGQDEGAAAQSFIDAKEDDDETYSEAFLEYDQKEDDDDDFDPLVEL